MTNSLFAQTSTNEQDLDAFVRSLEEGEGKDTTYTIDRTEETGVSFVDIFTDSDGKTYVLKQYRPRPLYDDEPHWLKDADESLNKQFKEQPMCNEFKDKALYKLVVEQVGSRIAEEMNIPMNRVRIIKGSVSFPLKKCYAFPANLHTFVEGKPGHANLLQNTGLTYEVLRNISEHPGDLASIAAFDLFTSNVDRNSSNLLYSEANDQFQGIDLGECFFDIKTFLGMPMPSMIQSSINSLRGMRDLTAEEKEGLRIYRDTLVVLSENYSVEKIISYLDEAKEASGLSNLDPSLYRSYEQKVKQVIRGTIPVIPQIIEQMNVILLEF